MIRNFTATILLSILLFGRAWANDRRPSLEQISEKVWIHKSYENIKPWGLVLSQGLFIELDSDLIMVDTAWNDRDTETLFSLALQQFGRYPDRLIVTHAHADKMGGMKAAHRLSSHLISYAHPWTQADAPSRGLKTASTTIEAFPKDLGIEIYYPGPGHARDNVVVYHPQDKVLFGGCLVRPGSSKSLGNTGDAEVELWAESITNLWNRFPEAKTVIPSHGPKAGIELLEHTIELANRATLTSFWENQRKAIQKKDPVLLSHSFVANCEFNTLAGGQIRGLSAVHEFWNSSLRSLGPGAKMSWQLVKIHQNSFRTATLHGRWSLKNAKRPKGYPAWGYFLEEIERIEGRWKVKRAYFWSVTEGHTRHLRPKTSSPL